jgi:hypothetical protein
MSRRYKIRNQNQLYFVTFTVIHLLNVFTRQDCRTIKENSRGKPKRIVDVAIRQGWQKKLQQHNHPIELGNHEGLYKILDYIHENPVKAGIVCSREDYFYSSAKNYAEDGPTL